MKYLWTTMHVKNLEESIAFYEEVVGLKLEHRFPAGPGTEIAFMKSEGTETKVELLCRADLTDAERMPPYPWALKRRI